MRKLFVAILLTTGTLFAAEDPKEVQLPSEASLQIQLLAEKLSNAALIQENIRIQYDFAMQNNENWKAASAAATEIKKARDTALTEACKELKLNCASYELSADNKKLIPKKPVSASATPK